LLWSRIVTILQSFSGGRTWVKTGHPRRRNLANLLSNFNMNMLPFFNNRKKVKGKKEGKKGKIFLEIIYISPCKTLRES
jgi:hypothetical protein